MATNEQVFDWDSIFGHSEIKKLPFIKIGKCGFFPYEFTSYDGKGKVKDHHIGLGTRLIFPSEQSYLDVRSML